MARYDTLDRPVYKLLEEAFFAPDLIPPGTEFEFTGAPGPTFLPLNTAAQARMEEWYMEDHPAADKEGNPIPGKTWKPHLKYRIGHNSTPAEERHLRILHMPTAEDQPQVQTLAETMAGMKKNTDQRPGPAQEFIDRKAEAAANALPTDAIVGEGVRVLAVPKPDPKDPKANMTREGAPVNG